MHEDATSPNGSASMSAPASENESATSDPIGDIIDREAEAARERAAVERAENARLIEEFGACSMLLLRKPHCWHPVAAPSNTPTASFMSRICCWCAPEGVQLVVGLKTNDPEFIVTHRAQHGRGIAIMQIDPDPPVRQQPQPSAPRRPGPMQSRGFGGIVLPGMEDFRLP